MNLKSILLTLLFIYCFTNYSNARVIHKTTNHSYGPTGDVDVNSDGIRDFYIREYLTSQGTTNQSCNPPSPALNYLQTIESKDYVLQSSTGTDFYQPIITEYLPINVSISISLSTVYGSSSLGGYTNIFFQPSNCGGQNLITNYIPPYQKSGYIGIKLILNGLIHFGWIQLSAGNIITAVAYESIPGYPIKTGDKIGYMSDVLNPSANIIRGKIYLDNNSNCIFNLGEVGVKNAMVYTTIGNYAGITDNLGNYEIYVPGGTANYSLEIDITPYNGYGLIKVCPTGLITCAFTGNNQTQTDKNFSVTTELCSKPVIAIKSDRRRRCFLNNTSVYIANNSSIASGATMAKVIMPQFVVAKNSIPAWDSKSGDTLIYNINPLTPFQSQTITIIDSVICGDESIRGLTQCTKAIISPKSYCYSTGPWDQADLKLSGSCIGSLYNCKISNSGNNMADSMSYRVFINGAIAKTRMVKLLASQSENIEIPTEGRAVRIEIDQTSGHPEFIMRTLNFEGCGNFTTESISKGILNQYPIINGGFAEATDCQPIRDSYDPNDKQAIPSGFDADNKILANGEIEYTIRFQNTGNDEAYTVVIADTLDSNLDFGNFRMVASSHPYKLEVTGKDSPRLVWIFGGINLPDSTTNEPASHGYITYRIAQKTDLAPGVVIKNKAHIFFDYNSAIITNEYVHTIHQEYPQDLLTVTTNPASVTDCDNSNHTLTSAGTGFGDLKYLWFKDNAELTGITSSSITIINSNVFDNGSYKCRIENGIDTVFTAPADVAVNTCNSTLEELQNKFNINIYPNPVSEVLFIESKSNAELSIFNNSGVMVKNQSIEMGNYSIPISSLNAGLYTLTFTIENQNYSTSIIKK